MTEETFIARLRRRIDEDISKTNDSITRKPVSHEFYCEQVGKLNGLRAALAHVEFVFKSEEETDLEE